jgi:hypothetical protein
MQRLLAKPSPPPKPKPEVLLKPKLTAEQVLDGFLKNTGGAAAYAKITSAVASGTVAFVGQATRGTVEIKSKAPNKFLMRLLLPTQGEVSLGFDGKEGWSRDPNLGLRILRGAELAQLKLQALQTNAPQNWRSYFKKVENLGVAKVGAASFYKLRLWPKDGSAPMIQFHDTTTLLLIRTDQVQESPQGKLSTTTYTSDWRLTEGVKTPFQMRQKTKELELVFTFTQLRNNVPLLDTDFVRPAEVPNKPAKVR